MNQMSTRLSNAYASEGGVNLVDLAGTLRHDVILHVPGDHPLAGDHRGLEQIAEFMNASREFTSDGERVELVDTLVGATHIGVLVKVTAARDDRDALVNHTIHLFAVDSDLTISEIWFHNRDQAAVDAFWTN